LADPDIPGGWLARAAAVASRHPALITGRDVLDYGTLYERLGRLAAALSRRGLDSARPVAILSRSARRVALAAYLGWYLGYPVLPLDPRREDHLGLLAACGARWVFADPDLLASLPSGVRRLPASALDEVPDRQVPAPTIADPGAVQLIIPTSGTTGPPRGVMLSGHNLAAAVEGARARMALAAGDIWLGCLPLFHIGGLSILLRCAQACATVLVLDRFDAAQVWDVLTARRVTHLSLVPAMLASLLDAGADARPPPSLKAVLVGGGALSGALARRARAGGWPILPSYGMSEAASQVATLADMAADWDDGDVGPPLPHLRVAIVDGHGRPTAGTGRIRVSGPSVMLGYADPRDTSGLGLDQGGFTSSDLGFLDDRGHLHVIGRADAVLVTGGENVHPAEVERQLSLAPGVVDVAITARADPVWGDYLVAVVVGAVDECALARWCRAHLPSPLRPREFVFADELPRNAMGKLERRRLRALVAAGRADQVRR